MDNKKLWKRGIALCVAIFLIGGIFTGCSFGRGSRTNNFSPSKSESKNTYDSSVVESHEPEEKTELDLDLEKYWDKEFFTEDEKKLPEYSFPEATNGDKVVEEVRVYYELPDYMVKGATLGNDYYKDLNKNNFLGISLDNSAEKEVTISDIIQEYLKIYAYQTMNKDSIHSDRTPFVIYKSGYKILEIGIIRGNGELDRIEISFENELVSKIIRSIGEVVSEKPYGSKRIELELVSGDITLFYDQSLSYKNTDGDGVSIGARMYHNKFPSYKDEPTIRNRKPIYSIRYSSCIGENDIYGDTKIVDYNIYANWNNKILSIKNDDMSISEFINEEESTINNVFGQVDENVNFTPAI